MRSLSAILSLTLATALIGCGGESPIGAHYTGQANVRSGPSAPLEIKGDVFFFQGPDGVGAAILPQGADASMRVAATVGSGRLTMEIPTGTGKIMGAGPISGDFRAPQATLSGDLTGPTAGDAGDWLFTISVNGVEISPKGLAGFAARAACFAACSYAGYSDASCNNSCGTSR